MRPEQKPGEPAAISAHFGMQFHTCGMNILTNKAALQHKTSETHRAFQSNDSQRPYVRLVRMPFGAQLLRAHVSGCAYKICPERGCVWGIELGWRGRLGRRGDSAVVLRVPA
jgi:hypothetical protein